MGKQLFNKEKIQVQYTSKLNFTDNDKSLQAYKDDAKKLIGEIEKASWDFDLTINAKAKKVDRVKSVVYPQLRNGHVGESGHDWQWQLDTDSAGSGSKIRLYLDDVKTQVKTTKSSDTVKVGKDQYTVLECEVTVSGKFTAGQKH